MSGLTTDPLPEEIVFTPEEIEKVKTVIRAARVSMRDWNECRKITVERMNTPLDAPVRLRESQKYR